MENNIVGEDMICPITKEHCDDECCTVGSECNMSGNEIIDISDGYHTFKELYEFRKVYNAALFNEWGKNTITESGYYTKGILGADKILTKYGVHKSWKHFDGELCFGGGWFIVVAILPTGQISNHYEAKDWDLFKIPTTEKALFEFDGHTSKDVINRLKQL